MTVSAFLDLDYPDRLGFSCLELELEFFLFVPFFRFKNMKRDRSERQTAWTLSFED